MDDTDLTLPITRLRLPEMCPNVERTGAVRAGARSDGS